MMEFYLTNSASTSPGIVCSIYLLMREESLLDRVIKFTELVTGNDWKTSRHCIVSLFPEMFAFVTLHRLHLPLMHWNFQEFMEYLNRKMSKNSLVLLYEKLAELSRLGNLQSRWIRALRSIYTYTRLHRKLFAKNWGLKPYILEREMDW